MSLIEQATIGAGCFWCAQQHLRTLDGVIDSRVGFASPTEDSDLQIEVVQIDFGPLKISYLELLEHFWKIHDPTSVDRQGEDAGVKYRSAVFVHDEQQRQWAHASRQALDESGQLPGPVVTEILELGQFLLAHERQRVLEQTGQKFSFNPLDHHLKSLPQFIRVD